MTASKKVSYAFAEALHVIGLAFPRRKNKTQSVLPHTVHNVRFYSLLCSVVKMNTEWLAVSKLSENQIVSSVQVETTSLEPIRTKCQKFKPIII